jgi:transposase
MQFGGDLVWGIEDCRSMTALLERDLMAAHQVVVRVPPHLMSRSRASSREPGKSDPIDALAVARAVLREPDLPRASHDETSWTLKLLVDRRDDLVSVRRGMINRLLERIHALDPAHENPTNWDRGKVRADLRSWLSPHTGLMAELARAELDDIDRLTEQILTLTARITDYVQQVAPHLLAKPGVGPLSAAQDCR